jgi:subtilase family serine protease
MSKVFLSLVASLVVCAGVAPGVLARGGPFKAPATDVGATNPNRVVPLTVFLRMHDTAALTSKMQSLHDPASPSFQSFGSASAVASAHAPTAAEAGSVSQFLASRGLTVTGVGPNNLFVQAVGTAAQASAAFKVSMRDFQVAGKTYFANGAKPFVPSSMQSLIADVSMTNYGPQPTMARRFEAGPAAPVGNPNGLVFSAGCFRPPQTVHFSSADASATYFGNRYGADITNTAPGTQAPCGYQPSEIQAAYGLDRLYAQKLDGRGQTIAIVDAFGSTTIENDAQAFSAIMGLPPVDLTIIGTPVNNLETPTSDPGNWALETTLDVEWAHSVAPGAKIVLVIAPSSSFADLFAAIVTASQVPGVSTISNSWSGFDIGVAGNSEFYTAADDILKGIAAQGISVNFSTGDFGDNASQLGGIYTSTGWPASSPFATSIGGVSLALDKNLNIQFQTAWGNNLAEIADTAALGNPPIDPPNNEGFSSGATGGMSDIYPQPFFQKGLPFPRRATPDISWLADPFTGVEIIFTGDTTGDLFIDVIGGTSLACPMFSALWAITTEAAGHNLGQAATYVYRASGNAVTDILPVSSPFNVTGTIDDAGGTQVESVQELAAPLQNLPSFFSAIYNSPFSTRWFVLTFGTDSTLAPTEGYDLATGVGVPSPPDFVKAIAHRH